MSQAAVLARTVGECRKGQIPRPLGRCKLDTPLLAAGALIMKGEKMGVFVIACKRMMKKCFEGEVTMPKVNFWMIGVICVLSGVVYGLLTAPLTHGVIIGSNSGNVSDSNNTSGGSKGKQDGKRKDKGK